MLMPSQPTWRHAPFRHQATSEHRSVPPSAPCQPVPVAAALPTAAIGDLRLNSSQRSHEEQRYGWLGRAGCPRSPWQGTNDGGAASAAAAPSRFGALTQTHEPCPAAPVHPRGGCGSVSADLLLLMIYLELQSGVLTAIRVQEVHFTESH